jgi:hypothetical protein
MIKSRRMRWPGHLVCMGHLINVFRILDGKPEDREHVGNIGFGGEDNIKMGFKEIRFEDVD